MKTIPQAFEALREALELTDRQREDASRQQNIVRDNLRRGLGAWHVRDFLTGSYKRRTAIRPLKDIDMFVELNLPQSRDGSPQTPPAEALRRVRDVLDRAYPTKDQPKMQTRSVNIDFTGTEIGFDVVPAVAHRQSGYWIPDRNANAWIRSDPERHEVLLQSANETAGSKLNPLVKMLKCWRRAHDVPVTSFHLEVMASNAFGRGGGWPPRDFPSGLNFLFETLSQAVRGPCPEPAGIGPAIDATLSGTDRDSAARRLVEAAGDSRKAVAWAAAGDVEGAHVVWRNLLGNTYITR